MYYTPWVHSLILQVIPPFYFTLGPVLPTRGLSRAFKCAHTLISYRGHASAISSLFQAVLRGCLRVRSLLKSAQFGHIFELQRPHGCITASNCPHKFTSELQTSLGCVFGRHALCHNANDIVARSLCCLILALGSWLIFPFPHAFPFSAWTNCVHAACRPPSVVRQLHVS